MKFGNNLQHLSIPEWKSYNLEYNELKYQIRLITQQTIPSIQDQNEEDCSTLENDLTKLHASFLENFDYINLFIQTKYGELNRKSNYFHQYFTSVITSYNENTDNDTITANNNLLIEIDEIYYQIFNLSIILKNVSKFIIIQKIACKKIFKKFIKYFPYKKRGYKFIYELKRYLSENPHSFINFNLTSLTLKLTNFFNLLNYEKEKIENSSSLHPKLLRQNSLFSIASTYLSSEYQNSILPPPTTLNTLQNQNDSEQTPQSLESHFDLQIYLKKNFQLHGLIPTDSFDDLILHFNIYLNLKNVCSDSNLSYIYLTNNVHEEPAIIVSIENFNYSTIIAPIGELRKYSYCILPNEIVDIFIHHLNDRSNEEYKGKLYQFFTNSNQLTKKTIDYIVKKNLKPNLKLFCNRKRYIIDEEAQGKDEEEEQYLMTLDSNIYTTNDKSLINSLKFEITPDASIDYFPSNHMCIYSNEISLSNFEHSLKTEINKDGVINNKHSSIKKFSSKLQAILTIPSITLFKNLNFYQYQLSCYYNIIPNETFINNHYTNLLNLNLLKNFEIVDINTHHSSQEQNMILAKSNTIIQHKQSIQSMQPQINDEESSKSSLFEFTPHNDEELSISPNDFFNIDVENENKFINKLILLKEKWFSFAPQEKQLHQANQPQYIPFNNHYSTYDSINEEPDSYLSRNNHQLKYEIEYDQTLAYIYFTLNLVSLFLSGLQLGIIYSIFNNIKNNPDSTSFLFIDNMGIFIILSISMVISILFCLISLNLLHYRNQKPPKFHAYIIYTGLSITVLDCLWSLGLFINF